MDIQERQKSFRALLKDLILEDAGSLVAFAKRIGFSKSQMTQLTGQHYSSEISYGTIALICRAFSSKEVGREVYQRYLRAFAPDPLEADINPVDSNAVDRFLAESKELVAAGYNRYVMRTAQRLYVSLRGTRGREEPAVRSALVLADGYFMRGLQPRGLQILNEVAAVTNNTKQQRLGLDFLMLRAIGHRALGISRLGETREAFAEVQRHLSGLPNSPNKRILEHGLRRDLVLLCWDEARWTGDSDNLRSAMPALVDIIDELETPNDRFLAHEVLARGAIVLGDFDSATRHLENLQRNGSSHLLRVKSFLSQARFSLAIGKPESAHGSIVKVVELSESGSFGHYQREAFRLQDVMLGNDQSQPSPKELV